MTTSDQLDRQPLYLEDLKVGQRFVSKNYPIEEADIKQFAAQFDPQPFHQDPEAAKNSFFGQLVASGWHTAALTMRMIVEGGPPIAGGSVGAGCEISWPRPTLPGSILHAESEVLELKESRSNPTRGMATMRTQTIDQNGNIVQILTAKVVVPRRRAAT